MDTEQESAIHAPALSSPTVFASPSAEGLLTEWLLKANGSPWQQNHLFKRSEGVQRVVAYAERVRRCYPIRRRTQVTTGNRAWLSLPSEPSWRESGAPHVALPLAQWVDWASPSPVWLGGFQPAV